MRAAAALLALALGSPAAAGPSRAWWVPDHVKAQTAGNLGLAVVGFGYAWHGHRLETDLLVGWAPPSIAGEHLWPVSGKLIFQPFRITRGRLLLRPLSASVQLTYTPGDEYFIVQPRRYPSGYYDVPTALRAGVALGGGLSRRVRGTFSEVGVYWELVALDVAIVDWVRNPRTIGPGEVFSFAIGARLAR